MNVLITGGHGFIGVNLTRLLSARDDVKIRVIDLLAAPHPPSSSPEGIETHRGDICDASKLEHAMRDIDVVIHLAAQTGVMQSLADPVHTTIVNVIGTQNVLEQARRAGVKKVVIASSNAVLGGAVPCNVDTLPRPQSPYGASKLSAEALCLAYTAAYGLQTVALRFSNAYGPHSLHKSSVVASFMTQALRDRRLIVSGNGSQTRDLIFVDDLCQAIWLAVERAPAGSLFQVGTGQETSISALASLIAAVAADHGGKPVSIAHDAPRPGEPARNVSNITHTSEVLGFRPEVALREGISRTFTWFNAVLIGPQTVGNNATA